MTNSSSFLFILFKKKTSGRYGLWLDSDLNRGTSTSCTTFMNPRLSATEDFVVKHLECWGFV